MVEEDRDKTTFITPWGRYRYRVAPQGYLASMDGYTHRFNLITEVIKNKATIVDNTLLTATTSRIILVMFASSCLLVARLG